MDIFAPRGIIVLAAKLLQLLARQEHTLLPLAFRSLTSVLSVLRDFIVVALDYSILLACALLDTTVLGGSLSVLQGSTNAPMGKSAPLALPLGPLCHRVIMSFRQARQTTRFAPKAPTAILFSRVTIAQSTPALVIILVRERAQRDTTALRVPFLILNFLVQLVLLATPPGWRGLTNVLHAHPDIFVRLLGWFQPRF